MGFWKKKTKQRKLTLAAERELLLEGKVKLVMLDRRERAKREQKKRELEQGYQNLIEIYDDPEEREISYESEQKILERKEANYQQGTITLKLISGAKSYVEQRLEGLAATDASNIIKETLDSIPKAHISEQYQGLIKQQERLAQEQIMIDEYVKDLETAIDVGMPQAEITSRVSERVKAKFAEKYEAATGKKLPTKLDQAKTAYHKQ